MERQVAHSEKNEKETQDKNFLRLLKFNFQSRLMDRKETANCPCCVQDCGLDLGLDRVVHNSLTMSTH